MFIIRFPECFNKFVFGSSSKYFIFRPPPLVANSSMAPCTVVASKPDCELSYPLRPAIESGIYSGFIFPLSSKVAIPLAFPKACFNVLFLLRYTY